MANYIIYKYTSPSGKSYIGQTNNSIKRKSAHKSPNNRCVAFASAIKKYGFDNFTYDILEENLTSHDANILEAHYIKTLNTLSPHGYNLKIGGENHIISEETRLKLSRSCKGKIITEATKQKIRESMIGEKNHFFGKQHSESTKTKFSQRIVAEETKAKISNTLKGKYCGELHPMYGKKQSQEAINAMRNKKTGMYDRRVHPNAKRYLVTFPTGETFDVTNLAKFCVEHGLHQGHMSSVACGKLSHYKKITCYKIIEEKYV